MVCQHIKTYTATCGYCDNFSMATHLFIFAVHGVKCIQAYSYIMLHISRFPTLFPYCSDASEMAKLEDAVPTAISLHKFGKLL